MTRPLAAAGILRYLVAVACLIVVVAGLKAAASIFIPSLLAFFLSVLSFPLLFWLRRKRVPAWLAVFLTMLSLLAILAVVGLVFTVSIDRVTAAAPRYQDRFQTLLAPLLVRLQGAGLEVSDWITTELLDLGRLLNLMANTFAGVAAAVSVGFLVPLITVFILLEALGFRRKLASALGADNTLLARFAKITREVQHYLVIKTAVSLATGVLIGLWVWLLGVDFPIFWGFIAFLFNYVPNIGSVVAGIPPVLLALVQLGAPRAVAVALGYVVVNFLIGNLLEPNLMGRRLRLSPLVVLLSLLFWGWVWGPVGMLLAVPLTMVIKIMLEHIESLRWLAKLLDQEPAPTPPAP